MIKIYNEIMGKTSLSFAYRMMKENILRLDLKPGQELKDVELQTKLRMSRTPIREAILLLKHDGLVENKKNGTCVKKISRSKFRDGCVLRSCLEKKMLKIACENFTEKELGVLEEILKEQEKVMNTTRDYQELHRLDIKFHQAIFEETGHNNLFVIAYTGFFDYWRVRELARYSKVNSVEILDGHKKIYSIIKNNTPKLIDEVMEEHFSLLDPELKELLDEYPFYFE